MNTVSEAHVNPPAKPASKRAAEICMFVNFHSLCTNGLSGISFLSCCRRLSRFPTREALTLSTGSGRTIFLFKTVSSVSLYARVSSLAPVWIFAQSRNLRNFCPNWKGPPVSMSLELHKAPATRHGLKIQDTSLASARATPHKHTQHDRENKNAPHVTFVNREAREA